MNLSIFNFKIFLIYYLLPFSVATIGIASIAGTIFEKKIILGSNIGGAYKVNRILTGRDADEVSIIGSSRAQGSYIPDTLFDNSFNYGIDGTGMNVHLLFLEEVLKTKSKSPVILNIDMEGFTQSNGDLGNYLYNLNDLPSDCDLGINFGLVRRLPVVKYYGYFSQYLKYYLNAKLAFTKAANKGGSFELNPFDIAEFKRSVSLRLKKPSKFRENLIMQKKLESLLKSANGRSIYLVVAPYHESYKKSFVGRRQFESYFKSLEKYPNVRFIDLSEMNLPDKYFFNTSHLTVEGARLFSMKLKDELRSIN